MLEKTTVILKTVVHDIATTSELGIDKKKISSCFGHVWNYFVLDFLSSINFNYTDGSAAPNYMTLMWHIWSYNDLYRRLLVLVFFKS